MECDNHPDNFDGYNPKKFARKFVKTNYFYQEACFEEMINEYEREMKGDKKRISLKDPTKKRVQLANGLEKVVAGIKGLVLEGFKEVSLSCKNYMKNPLNQRNI